MTTRFMLVVLGLALPFASLACEVQITDGGGDDGEGGNGGGDDCESPPPAGICGGDWTCVDGDWIALGDGGCEPCPLHQPSDGDSCPSLGQSCQYEQELGCDTEITTVTSSCTEDGWLTAYPYCQPEPVCPDDMPAAGTDCSGWEEAYWCSYPTNCGAEATFAQMHCDISPEGSTWVLDSEPTDCQAGCSAAENNEDCAVIAGCQWLEPGCADGPQLAIPAGCYPLEDCTTSNACVPGEVCTPHVYDPCFESKCTACGGDYSICTPDKL